MMKKNGFTLAEVLITLAIIGVVATMTLPALMTNTQEQQARTGLKKGINTLTEAAQMNQALEGWDFASTLTTDTLEGIDKETDLTKMSFEALIANRTSVDYGKGTALPEQGQIKTTLAGYKAVYLRDGSAIYYNENVINSEAKATTLDDGLASGFVVYYDTNGASGPNLLSNCGSTPLGKIEDPAGDVTAFTDIVTPYDAAAACEKKTRVIKDVFAVRLRGNIAQPNGNASTWLIEGDVKENTGS